MKKQYKDQNNGHLPADPPNYLGTEARSIWRRVVPFLESNSGVKRIDFAMVEIYATQYEIYKNAYQHINKHGEVQSIYRTLQDSTGAIVGKDFVGYRRNPMTQIYDSALKNLAKIGSELGLSPKGRAELLQIIDDNDSDKPSAADQLKEFLSSDED